MIPSDEALMSAYANGDAEAFRELFRRYAPRLRAVLWCAIREDAADLVQQTFLQLHRAREKYALGARFRPWLMTIARNLKREHVRRTRRQPIDGELAERLVAHARPSAETMLELSRALGALKAMPSTERKIIRLRCEGFTVAETAARVRATKAAVKARAHRGYRRLRETNRSDHGAGSGPRG